MDWSRSKIHLAELEEKKSAATSDVHDEVEETRFTEDSCENDAVQDQQERSNARRALHRQDAEIVGDNKLKTPGVHIENRQAKELYDNEEDVLNKAEYVSLY